MDGRPDSDATAGKTTPGLVELNAARHKRWKQKKGGDDFDLHNLEHLEWEEQENFSGFVTYAGGGS